MSWPRFGDATARLVALHVALVTAATLMVLALVYWQVGGVIDAEQREVVEAELRGLADDYLQGGTPALDRTIGRRLAAPRERNAVYLLADPLGRRIAGNLAAWPPQVVPGEGWVTLELYRLGADRPTTISAVTVRLALGERLLVGRDVAARAAFDAALARALMWALGAMLVLAVAMGWLFTRLVLRRIAGIGTTAQAIMAGRLDRRVPLSGSGDEFDRLAATLNAMLERIGALVGDLRMVTDSLAHDLRRPLGRLSRHLDAALEPGLDPAARTERIAGARAEAERVLAVSSELLEISRVEAGLAAEQFETVDIGRLAADAAELYAAVAEESGRRIALAAAPGLAVRGHPQLLARALSNLLDNALRYAPEGSAIAIAAARGDDGAVALSVADRGPGIAPADRARVTGRFVRLDPSRGGDGSGLGLALVDAVARLHGARLDLGDNAPGLRAVLRLPPAGGPADGVRGSG